jgi:hypothetical protein
MGVGDLWIGRRTGSKHIQVGLLRLWSVRPLLHLVSFGTWLPLSRVGLICLTCQGAVCTAMPVVSPSAVGATSEQDTRQGPGTSPSSGSSTRSAGAFQKVATPSHPRRRWSFTVSSTCSPDPYSFCYSCGTCRASNIPHWARQPWERLAEARLTVEELQSQARKGLSLSLALLGPGQLVVTALRLFNPSQALPVSKNSSTCPAFRVSYAVDLSFFIHHSNNALISFIVMVHDLLTWSFI